MQGKNKKDTVVDKSKKIDKSVDLSKEDDIVVSDNQVTPTLEDFAPNEDLQERLEKNPNFLTGCGG